MNRRSSRSFAVVLEALHLIVALGIATACLQPLGIATAQESRTADTASVERVLDGDTYVLSGGQHVRLIGLDTPEKGEPFADIARAFADSLLCGKTVRIELDRLRNDRYDRLLGYVYLDTIFVNELLIRKGLARVYQFKENRRYSARLISAQKEARKRKAGIWSLLPPPLEPYYISAGGSFRFHRPLCPSAKNVNPRKARKYKSRDAALDDGLSPCRQCRP